MSVATASSVDIPAQIYSGCWRGTGGRPLPNCQEDYSSSLLVTSKFASAHLPEGASSFAFDTQSEQTNTRDGVAPAPSTFSGTWRTPAAGPGAPEGPVQWSRTSDCSTNSDGTPNYTGFPQLDPSSISLSKLPSSRQNSEGSSVGPLDWIPCSAGLFINQTTQNGLLENVTIQQQALWLKNEVQERDMAIQSIQAVFTKEKMQILREKQVLELELEQTRGLLMQLTQHVRRQQAEQATQAAQQLSTLLNHPTINLQHNLTTSYTGLRLATAASNPIPSSNPGVKSLVAGPASLPKDTLQGPTSAGPPYGTLPLFQGLPVPRAASMPLLDGKSHLASEGPMRGSVDPAGALETVVVGNKGITRGSAGNCYHCHANDHNWSKCTELSTLDMSVRAGLIEEYKRMTDADRRNERPRRARAQRFLPQHRVAV